MDKRPWTVEEENYLKEHFSTTATVEIAQKLDRSYTSVSNHANTVMGLKKDEAFLKANGGRLQGERGKEARFKKGDKPFNIGLKQKDYMSEEQIFACSKTRFKKGHIPPNTYPEDGVITVRPEKMRDGTYRKYHWIRIAKGKWLQLHKFLWECNNGPVPKGLLVVFKDGNTMNCTIENLELIDRRENMKRNTMHRFGDEVISLIRTKAQLTRGINKASKRLKNEK